MNIASNKRNGGPQKPQGKCTGTTPELWTLSLDSIETTNENELTPLDQFKLRTARTTCKTCQAQTQCLTYALQFTDAYGIYAGTTGIQRATLQQQTNQPQTPTPTLQSPNPTE